MIRSAETVALTALLFAVLSACSDSTGLSSRDMERIGGGISFGIIETYRFYPSGVGEPELTLSIETNRLFGCANYTLDLDMKVEGEAISVAFLGVNEPDYCLTSTGPAYAYLPLPALGGDLSLSFSFSGKTDLYQASISDQSIEIAPRKGRFSQRQEERLWRYPPRSFALVCDAEVWGEEVCSSFRSLLLTEINLVEISFPEGGKNPYPTDTKEAGRNWRAWYFQLGQEEDFLLVNQVFCSFVSTRPDLAAYLLSWKNERVRSWVPSSCPAGPGTG